MVAASLEHIDNGMINSMLHMVYNVKQALFTCRCCVFFPWTCCGIQRELISTYQGKIKIMSLCSRTLIFVFVFLVFPPCQKRSTVILEPSFAAFLRALSESRLVHFILRTVSNKINRSVCWET